MRKLLLPGLLTVALTLAVTAMVLVAIRPQPTTVQADPAQPAAARSQQPTQPTPSTAPAAPTQTAEPAEPAAPTGPADDSEPFPVAGLTADQALVGFASNDPQNFTTVGLVTGLEGDTKLVGIDCRNTDNTVYGLGDRGGIYTLSLQTAAATKVSQLTVPLEGTTFDIDFNPAANRLRVISDTGQNLRHNLDDPTGLPPVGVTVADTPLTSPPTTETAIGITGAAYYNNDRDPATATTLFVLDATNRQVAIQSPANAGLLAATGTLGVEAEAGSDAGFDVHYTPDDTAGGSGRALATLKADGTWRLYQVELLTGTADLIGDFPAEVQVTDLTAGFRRDELYGITLGTCGDSSSC